MMLMAITNGPNRALRVMYRQHRICWAKSSTLTRVNRMPAMSPASVIVLTLKKFSRNFLTPYHNFAKNLPTTESFSAISSSSFW